MVRPVLVVQSVTYAIKGQELLQKHGIGSRIVRNNELKALSGCGYALAPFGDVMAAQRILNSSGIKVLRVVKSEVPS